MSATAMEAYKRFEQSCAESSSVKNSPKSPQILPPPPPPPKPAPPHIALKKVQPVGVEVSRLLVPPPPPPPPPPQPPKDIPPPPPPRRPRITPVEQLPPPPPPPKRLKPARLSAPTKDLVASQTPDLEINEPPAEERYSPAPAQAAAPTIDEDDEEEEVLDDVDDSDIESISDDSEDDSEGENDELPSQTFLRQDETGRIIKVTRRQRKKAAAVENATKNFSEPANPSQEQQAVPMTEEEEVEKKP
ncbi:hypothetical protein ANCCEY_05102 [Ancylostoma ceylanicum]|uniref:Uncharacterized protein n=1 Tax=Ancylostoma ceylanicum TaxID=53326 RepID=A0A0D6LXA1_9BILA|nr:hypothetical protein ANCCEY_05102 [Ancylostoma ceylanicum]